VSFGSPTGDIDTPWRQAHMPFAPAAPPVVVQVQASMHYHHVTFSDGSDVTWHGRWTRTYDGSRMRYYYGRVRVPWLAWAMFS
jgi:hypothetical protein